MQVTDNIALTQADLVKRLLDNLPSGYTKATVNTPNSPFTTPSNKKWLRATVIPFNTVSDAATGCFKITNGLFVVDSFYPKGSYDNAQLVDHQAIKTLFENQTFNNTQCQTVSTLTVGDTGNWYQIQSSIEFYMEGL